MNLQDYIGKQVKVRNSGRYNGIYTLEKVYNAPSGVLYCNITNEKGSVAVPFYNVVDINAPSEMTKEEKFFYGYYDLI